MGCDEVALASQGGTSVVDQMDQLSRRRDKLLPKLQKILLSIGSPGYSNKVPAHIRQKMELKVSSEYKASRVFIGTFWWTCTMKM